MKNVTPSPHESEAQAAKWDAIGRIAALSLLPLVAFIALIIHLAWPQFEASAPWVLFALYAIAGMFIAGAIYTFFSHQRKMSKAKLERYKLETLRFAPDFNGNYEAYLDLANRTFIQPTPGNMQVPVPQTYSPHITYRNDVEQLAGAPVQGQLPAPEVTQPSLETIIEELRTNTFEFAFGANRETGELVKTTLPKAVHIQLIGSTGQGKSRQATGILTQLCSRNDPNHLQLALIDCEGETTAPFQALPHVRYLADEPKEAARTLRSLVSELERRDVSRLAFPVILIFVEEFLNLRRTMPADYRDQALEDYTTLALRGRKRGMYLFSIGQTAYTEKSIRDAQMQFLSSMAFAIKPTAARASGFTNTELLNKLYAERRPGQFLLERPAGDSILLAPYVDPRLVPGLLDGFGSTSPATSTDEVVEADTNPGTKPTEPSLDARSLHIRDMLKQGMSQRQIIQDVWGVSSGAAYTKAAQELAKIIATFV